MARLMDGLHGLDHSVRRKYKKVFERLSDCFIVRTPPHDDTSVATIVIEGPNQSWLFIGNHVTPPGISDLQKFTALNENLGDFGYGKINYLAVCLEYDSLFSDPTDNIDNFKLVEQREFWNRGEFLIKELANEFNDQSHIWIKKHLVSESVINAECTTRREAVSRDNSAKFGDFFLDYDQELATKYDMWDEDGTSDLEDQFSVRLINGVAGCGKTLILINRAILFCKRYPEKNALLLIHNKPVTENIQFKFEEYLGGKPSNLMIKTFHSYARMQQAKLTPYPNLLFTEKQKQPYLRQIFSNEIEAYANLVISDEQIWSEIEYINEFLIENREAYLNYERQGRGFSLSKAQREHIWELYELACELMSCPKNGLLPSLYIKELCLKEYNDFEFDTFDQILIDEAQFFSPSWLELVKKSIKDRGQLFICADPNQGFLKSRLSWKRIGLNVRGRTKKLSYSYRTTYEIMLAANTLLSHLDEDSEDFIKPDLEKMTRGRKPQVVYVDNPQDEQMRFLNELDSCVNQNSVPMQQIIVLCGDSINPWNVKKVIGDRLGHHTVINCNDSKEKTSQKNRIRVMSINSCTGMEAGVIFVLGVGPLLDKSRNLDLNDDEKRIVYSESIRKLYVAMTRAGQKLVLFSTERLPQEVEVLVDIDGSSYDVLATNSLDRVLSDI